MIKIYKVGDIVWTTNPYCDIKMLYIMASDATFFSRPYFLGTYSNFPLIRSIFNKP